MEIATLDEKAQAAAKMIESSSYAIVFTGAGISAESGIPTFRGPGGLWEKYDPMKYASIEGFMEDPIAAWKFYAERARVAVRAKPNLAHTVIAKMEEAGLVKAVITQNVDGLHRRAGSKNVIELHGTMWRLRCFNPYCDYVAELRKPPEELPPRCPKCGTILRPDVVLFGEPLPQDALREAFYHAARADLVLVVGTSGVVYPAAMIPQVVKENGGKLIDVNPGDDAYVSIADLYIRAKASEALRSIGRYLGLI
ncbi:MAG: NAD-dependent protein deacetylase [Thermoproteota archaeon]